MSERQWCMIKNLVTNPYTWVFFVFALSLPMILRYIRRFYPKSLQEAMEKEEACTLELNRRPEMKRLRKFMFIGLFCVVLISYLLSFYLLSDVVDPLMRFYKVLVIGIIIVIVPFIYYENKIRKGQDCKDVIVGYKFIKIVGIIEICLIVTVVIMNILGYLK